MLSFNEVVMLLPLHDIINNVYYFIAFGFRGGRASAVRFDIGCKNVLTVLLCAGNFVSWLCVMSC